MSETMTSSPVDVLCGKVEATRLSLRANPLLNRVCKRVDQFWSKLPVYPSRCRVRRKLFLFGACDHIIVAQCDVATIVIVVTASLEVC